MLATIARVLFRPKSLFLLVILAGTLQAQVEPDRSGVGQAEFRAAELNIDNEYSLLHELPSQAASNAAADLSALGLAGNSGRVDKRGGRWATLMMAEPLLPGQGKGNGLRWASLGHKAPGNSAEHSQAASQAFRGFLEANSHPLRIDLDELADPGKVTVYRDGKLIHIYMPRVFNGVPVRGSYLSAKINHGNLILLGANNWGEIKSSTAPGISKNTALNAVQSHVDPYPINGAWGKTELTLVPVAQGLDLKQVPVGKGYDYRLAWVIRPSFDGDLRHFEALVDAQSGELLSFEDTNQYAATPREVKGGVYPVSNDGDSPDGVEQAGWPMPFDNIDTPGGIVTTDSGGNLPAPVDGNITSNLSGQFIHIKDNCGAINLTSSGNIDFGSSGGTDCTTPGSAGGTGNTHASRTGFHELNRIAEMGRGQLPNNSWLQQQLTSEMNINLTCNAFWGGGQVNFYRSGGGCFNTGEIAGVFDHEWGHGLDDNDALPSIASPSGEGIADIYTALRLNDSCIGRNFRATNCTGFGDPCLDCTGVRDIDYLKRQSGQPHDYSWSNANCGGSVHCVGAVYAEAVWSLWKSWLQSAPYNYDNNTAHEIVTRLTYFGGGNTGAWFSGGAPNGGCGSTSGYMNYLIADDDNGNLNDGTPHMTAIFNAFDDQEIACSTPTVQDSGCTGNPTSPPTVSGTASDKSASLSWGAVSGAASYEVFRTDGVFECNFGKVRLGETTGTVWNDTGLQNGRDYSYVVIPKGLSDACFGRASSCTTVQPASGPNLAIDTGSASLSITGGDVDQYLDNCEDEIMTFDVDNTGLGSLTNVRIVSVTSSNGGVAIATSFPSVISSALAEGATGNGSFSITAGGLTPGEALTFQVEMTADELTSSRFADLVVLSTETDLTFTASQTYSFESGNEGWTVVQGTFDRSSDAGGAGGTTWYEQSSANTDDQCDQIQSPVMVLSATSALTLSTNYDIEPYHNQTASWYDRANVGIHEVVSGNRTAVNPSGGRLYNAGGGEGTCGTSGQDGWAAAAATWASSSWSAGALGSASLAGQAVQLDVRYGTDPSLNGDGFRFDEVTVTDVSFQGADVQSNSCSVGCTVNADCDDGAFCNGVETCNAGTCQAGTTIDCSDGVNCTDDACNESTDACGNVTNDGNCNNSFFCDGIETCDAVLDCREGTPVDCADLVVCTVDSCNEGTDACDNIPNDGICANGVFCDGAETCDTLNGCQAGTPPTCDDSVGCTDDSCNVGLDECDYVANDANCDDSAFCNGIETCDATLDCQTGSDPCPGQSCDEGGDVCEPLVCDNDGVCGDGENCTNCANDCISGSSSGAVCGNSLCEAGDGENATNCSADCNGVLNGKPTNRFSCGSGDQYTVGCGDSRCTTGGYSCTFETAPSGSYCCGDSTCEGAEDSDSCALDCGPAPFCGDGTCGQGEDQCNCVSDCGVPPSSEAGLCTDKVDNDCDAEVDCNDSQCSLDPACESQSCQAKNASCDANDDCCSGICKNNGRCR